MSRRYWLMKSEPETFSIEDLARAPKKTTGWDGVRNYQARNFMKAMKQGERVLFYHSSTEPLGVVGTAVVAREAYPDSTAWKRGRLLQAGTKGRGFRHRWRSRSSYCGWRRSLS